MKDYIECTPVMLPGNGPLYEGGTGLHLAPGMGIGIGNQHLYLVSEEEIKEGDWYEYTGVICQREGIPIGKAGRKIIATTDKSLSLPLIPTSFIERWVNEQGKIDKVRIKLDGGDPYDGDIRGIPKLTNPYGTGEVIILPIEDKLYSMEDMEEAFKEGVIRSSMNYTDRKKEQFQKWFDKNY